MLSATPTVGFYVATASTQDYSFPFFAQAQWMYGLLSTSQTASVHGFGVGLGMNVRWYHQRWSNGKPNYPFSRWMAFEFENRDIAGPTVLIRPQQPFFTGSGPKATIQWSGDRMI